jgi:hypothetical protein
MKYGNQIAKLKQIDITTTGFIPILSDMSTINGANSAPYKLNASIIPAAVD